MSSFSRLPKFNVLYNNKTLITFKIVNHTQLHVLYETNKTIGQVKYTSNVIYIKVICILLLYILTIDVSSGINVNAECNRLINTEYIFFE